MRRTPLRLSRRTRLVALAAALLLVVLGAVVAVRAVQEERVERDGWALRWQDEFDGDALDWFRWNAQDVQSPRNQELQYYTPNDVSVEDGHLRLSSHRASFRGRAFTSGAVDTHGKFSFTYGRVEVRARLPEMGQGIWPAVWMLGNACNPLGDPCPWPTPTAAEIDIVEVVNDPTALYLNVHHGSTVGTSESSGFVAKPVPDLSERFHTFAIEWEPGGVVRWYLDDEQLAQRQVPGVFDQPMYLVLNTAVGGTWPGPPEAGTPFPQEFDVDYVRVYQRP